MTRLFFLFISILILLNLIYPFLIKVDIRFNLLKLKGTMIIKLFNKFKFELKFRIKHGYVYINHKNKSRKEKITDKNVNIVFFLNLVNQLYFREQLLDFYFISNFGYVNNSCITAVGCGYVEVLVKSFLAKLKNNKKSAHIFVETSPKYNQDILNFRVATSFRISVFDIIYALIVARVKVWKYYPNAGKT